MSSGTLKKFLRWLLADEIWQASGTGDVDEYFNRLSEFQASRRWMFPAARVSSQSPKFLSLVAGNHFFLRYRPTPYWWFFGGQHCCFEGTIIEGSEGVRIVGRFRLCGLVRLFQLFHTFGILAIALVLSANLMVAFVRVFLSGNVFDLAHGFFLAFSALVVLCVSALFWRVMKMVAFKSRGEYLKFFRTLGVELS